MESSPLSLSTVHVETNLFMFHHHLTDGLDTPIDSLIHYSCYFISLYFTKKLYFHFYDDKKIKYSKVKHLCILHITAKNNNNNKKILLKREGMTSAHTFSDTDRSKIL